MASAPTARSAGWAATAFAVLRLALWFLCIGLATSRLALIAHELAGHGGAASLLGGEVTGWRLFLFGGGWIRYDLAAPPTAGEALFVSLAGVGIEIALAAGLLIAIRALRARAPIAALASTLAALLLVVHATYYFAAGSHHGYGDGRALHDVAAPGARWALVLAASALGAIAAYALGGQLAMAARWLGGPRWRRFGLTAAAAVVAALLHGGLAWGEQRWQATDRTYSAVMQRQVDRRVAAELARLAAEAAATGAEFDAKAQRRELVRRYRAFPLGLALVGVMLLAAAAGLWRRLAAARAAATPSGPPRRALVATAAVTVCALILVAALAGS